MFPPHLPKLPAAGDAFVKLQEERLLQNISPSVQNRGKVLAQNKAALA